MNAHDQRIADRQDDVERLGFIPALRKWIADGAQTGAVLGVISKNDLKRLAGLFPSPDPAAEAVAMAELIELMPAEEP